MMQVLALIEGLPEAVSLFFLGACLVASGMLIRKAVRAYERTVARKDVPGLKANGVEARP